MAANFRIFPVDRVIHLVGVGSSLNAGVWDDTGSGTAAYAVNGDAQSFWLPGAATADFDVNLGASYPVRALGIYNHNLTGISWKWTDDWHGVETVVANLSPTANVDMIAILSSATDKQYWKLTCSTAASAIQVGCFAFLDDDYLLELSGVYAPRYNIGRNLIPGHVELASAGRIRYRQIVSAAFRQHSIQISNAPVASGSLWGDVEDAYFDTDGLPDPIWWRDDTSAAVLAAGHCGHITDIIPASIVGSGGRVAGTLNIEELVKEPVA